MRIANYKKIFQRNLGIFNKEQFETIRKLRVGVVGAGALGGSVANMLARLGVGEIRLADPEKFEYSNINRQFGAYVDTVGKNKAEAISRELKRINPSIITVVEKKGINKKNIYTFIKDCDAIVDAIEFFEVEKEILLYKYARQNKIWVFNAQAVMSIFTVFSFDPQGIPFEKMFINKNKIDFKKIIHLFFPKLPKEANSKLITQVIKTKKLHISSYSVPPPIGASFVVNELIKTIIEKKKPAVRAPGCIIVDMERLRIQIIKAHK